MRKLLSTILIFSFNAYAVPPVAVNGERQANAFVQNIKVPNSQATSLGGINTRLETGNSNLLINPSFEASTASTSHTLTNATAADDTTHKTDGAKGIAVTPTSNGGGIKQSSTTNAAYLAGSQGVVKASVYTTGTDVHVCPLINGSRPSDVTKYCALVPKSTSQVPMPEIIVPFIMDGTSNGYDIFSDTTTAFTVDEVSVGKSAPFQGVSGAKLVGTITYPAAAGCSWSTASTSFVALPANASCGTPVVTGQARAPGTKIPAIVLDAQAGTYYFVASGFISHSGTSDGYYQISDGTNSTNPGVVYNSASGANAGVPNYSGQITLSSSMSSWTPQVYGRIGGGTNVTIDTTVIPFQISVYYFPPESRIYSQASTNITEAMTLIQTASFTNATITGALTTNTANGILSYNSSTGIYTALKDCVVTASASFVAGSATVEPAIVKNSTILSLADSVNTGGYRASSSASFNLSAGETFYFKNASSANATTSQKITVTAIVSAPAIVGRFVDTINDTGSTKPISKKTSLTCTSSSAIISQGLGSSWITSIGNIASGACAVVIPSGIFNSTPICQVTPRGNGVATNAWKVTESSATSISLYCSNAGANCTTGESVNVTCEGLGI